jgi:hypothetical protein
MTASSGSTATSQSSVCQIGGHVVRTSGSLYGGATGFNSQAYSLLCIYQWYRCWWFSEPPLHRRHHSVYNWPFFGHLSNLQMSFSAIQHSFSGLQLLLNTSKTKCMLFNRLLPAPARITTLDGSDLEYVDNYKYLCVLFECKLSSQTHINFSRIGGTIWNFGWKACPNSTACYSSPEGKIYIWIENTLKFLKLFESCLSITELMLQVKPRGQTIQIFFKVTLLSMVFHWESIFLRDLLALPTASTGCHQSLDIGWGFSFV